VTPQARAWRRNVDFPRERLFVTAHVLASAGVVFPDSTYLSRRLPSHLRQLVYRAGDGSAVYGQPVSTGEDCLRLDKTPKNGTVIAVVSNTD
jgi:hypothetical protein